MLLSSFEAERILSLRAHILAHSYAGTSNPSKRAGGPRPNPKTRQIVAAAGVALLRSAAS
jgi:hypothetical protein